MAFFFYIPGTFISKGSININGRPNGKKHDMLPDFRKIPDSSTRAPISVQAQICSGALGEFTTYRQA